MLPFRSSRPTRRTPSGIDRLFSGALLAHTNAGSTYSSIPLEPATPTTIGRGSNDQLESSSDQEFEYTNKMKRACGLPIHIADFILDLSHNDLFENESTSQTATTALVPASANPAAVTSTSGEDDDDDKDESTKYTVPWPTSLRPRAVPEPIGLVLSSSRELVLYEPNQVSLLMSMPAEIRELIYLSLLAPSAHTKTTIPATDPVPAAANVFLLTPSTQASDLQEQALTFLGTCSLLLTSKHIRAEFLPLFAARYTYTFSAADDLIAIMLPKPLGASDLSLSWTHLAHVELTTDIVAFGGARSIRAYMQLASLTLYCLPSLQTLILTMLPAAYSPVRFLVASGDDGASALNTYQCSVLHRYGAGTGFAARGFAADLLGVRGMGWGEEFLKLGELLQGWMRRERIADLELFGGMYVSKTGGAALSVKLVK
ncbi:uncharacterized protein HMPREF1541_09260 [Cyphellophora europaea CBS 101466]|uniref:Uncharacterized protein n=1 Tax=Cyphellophora europaea (strain CBS 101466) TaxID=1220924 RepID=W2SBZ0_CYPE1|nr:uncharacterized protein HMPREF1541_09260 [Cyphellophora europaea CBS 101466]ETN45429.1 hypothetical protein HMPREF1541_09260 [Cyphellophora europaea CBS 101466]